MNKGCVWALVICAGLFGLAILGRNTSDWDRTSTAAAIDANLTASIAAQAPPSVEPLDGGALRRGAAHFRTAAGVDGLAGAMIYSQNCYDALSRKFSWAKLDQCGAFDQMASRTVAADDALAGSEADWFEPEIAAGRYLAAATGASHAAGDADTRLAELQRQAGDIKLPRLTRVAPAVTDETDNSLEGLNTALADVEDEAEEPRAEE